MTGIYRRALIGVVLIALMFAATTAVLLVARRRQTALPAVSAAVMREDADPVTRFRTERGELRQQHKSQLNGIIYDAATDAQTLASAKRQLMALMEAEEAELTLEGVLAARGYDGALVTVHPGSVNVILRSEAALTARETAVILDLVLRETGVTGGNVKIIPII